MPKSQCINKWFCKNYITAENVVPIRSSNIISSLIFTVVSVTNIISHSRENIDVLILFFVKMTENILPLILASLLCWSLKKSMH